MKPSFHDSANPIEAPRRVSRRHRRARASHVLLRLAVILCAADLLMLLVWR